jgi:hypothetical protein
MLTEDVQEREIFSRRVTDHGFRMTKWEVSHDALGKGFMLRHDGVVC